MYIFLLFILVASVNTKKIWKTNYLFNKSKIHSNYLFNKSKIHSNFNNLHSSNDYKKPLYTLVWYDNIYAQSLINEMNSQNLRTVFIDMGEYLFDPSLSPYHEINRPMFYKDMDEITNWYDIYKEIYKF